MKPKFVYYLNCDGIKNKYIISKACKKALNKFRNINETWYVIPVYKIPSRIERI